MFLRAVRTALARSTDTRRAPRVSRPPRLEFLEVRDTPSTFTVDDDGLQNANADFTSIQAAVDAAGPNDNIRVYAGTYHEQVTIPSNLNGLTLSAVAGVADRTVISPFDFKADATEAVVHVDGADNVDIRGFLITGRDAPSGVGAGANYGVLIDEGGSAKVRDCHITTIRDLPLSGVQEGIGIQYGFTDSAGNVLSSASGLARHNVIEDYQKGGVAVIGSASNGDIHDNTIRGVGPTSVIAQNGIQISDGATADVRNNTVSGNVYTPATFLATGILLQDTNAKVLVRNNNVTACQAGIYLFFADNHTVQNNTSSNNTSDGILVINSNDNTIRNNNCNNNVFDGIYVDFATGNKIQNNNCNFNGLYGIELTATTSNNTGSGNTTNGNGTAGIQDDGTDNDVT